MPAITTTVGKCIGIYSRNLSALRTLYSLILSNGGVTDACMNRLARLSDTITHQSLLTKLNAMAQRWDVPLQRWQQFNIVLDNVDMFVRPRHDDSSKSNKMYHMVQAIAVKDRVLPEIDHEPNVPIDSLKPADVYANQSDIAHLKQLMAEIVVQVLAEMPALQNLKLKRESKKHVYSPLMTRKSEVVSKYHISCISRINYINITVQ